MILHEERYLAYIQQHGVGDKDQVASSPRSYVSYLNSASSRLGQAISPEILYSEDDIDSISSQLKGRLAAGTIRNCRSAMRQYVAMVRSCGLWHNTAIRQHNEA